MSAARRRFWFSGFLATVLALTAGVVLISSQDAEAAPAAGVDEAGSYEDRCGGGSHSVSVHGRDGRYGIKVKQGRCRLAIEMRGDIEFSTDENGVANMSRRARLEITEKVGGSERRVLITPGDGGEPVHEWSVDGQSTVFDDEARDWLRQILPEIFRTTGIDVEGRVGRLLESGGTDRVLDEVRLVSGDHTQRRYLGELIRQAELKTAELEGVLRVADREISSDFELAELLIGMAGDLDRKSLRLAYARATESIGSDFELRRVIDAYLGRETVDPETLDALLATAGDISSDFEAAELLIEVCEVYPRGEPLPDSFYTVLGTVGSDFEHRRVLDAARKRPELTHDTVEALLVSSREVGSDFEMAEFLVGLARAYPIDDELRPSFTQALDTVGSTHERQRVLASLGRQSLDRP